MNAGNKESEIANANLRDDDCNDDGDNVDDDDKQPQRQRQRKGSDDGEEKERKDKRVSRWTGSVRIMRRKMMWWSFPIFGLNN